MATGNGPGYREDSGAGRDMGLGGSSTSASTVAAATPHVTGCPCGCETQPQLADDPECVRNEPSMGERYKRKVADRDGWKPARSRPWAFIEVDAARDIAMIRGREGIKDALEFIGCPYGWSRAGRGWVFDAKYVPDVVAYGQWRHELVIVSKRRQAVAAS